MSVWTRLADLVGADPYPAEEPQAAADRERLQPQPDYTHAPESEPEEYIWVLNGTHISVHTPDQAEHADLFDLMGYDDFSRPHAWGKLYLHTRWDSLWEVEKANMALHLVEKRLKKYAKDMGWKYSGLVDEYGSPMEGLGLGKVSANENYFMVWLSDSGLMPQAKDVYRRKGVYGLRQFLVAMLREHDKRTPDLATGEVRDDVDSGVLDVVDWDLMDRWFGERTGSYPGVGETMPEKTWRRQMGDLETHNMGGEGRLQPDYYGEQDMGDELPMTAPRLCSDCGYLAMDYNDWREHTLRNHVNPKRQPTPIPQPVVDLDDVLPAGFNNSTMDKTVQRQSRLIYKMGQGQQPLIPGPIPFIYDIESDRIFVGHPGERHADIQGRFTPGGIVEGVYDPKGGVQIRTDTDMPYTVRHMIQLWYAMHPELEIKNVYLLVGDKKVKLAKLSSANIGHKVRNLAATDPAAWAAYRALREHGNVYVVGGAVRDVVLGKLPKDVDLMVQGLPMDEVLTILEALPGRVDVTGAQFGVIRYKDEDGNETEIALPREEMSTGEGHQDFLVTTDPFLPVETDLARRDFTGNAMAVNLDTGELVDPYNGAEDLKKGRLHSHNDKAFEEDPLRMLRALSSISRHRLDPSPELFQALRENAWRIAHVSPERIGDEMDKIMLGEDPAKAMELAAASGLLNHVFPELQKAVGFDQRNKHHGLLLYDHLMQVLRRTAELTDDLNTRWAALLHDVGKPDSYWEDDEGWGHYYRNEELDKGAQHELVGADQAREILTRLRRPNDQVEAVSHMVRWHMWAPFTSSGGARRYVNRVGPEYAEPLLHLREADSGGKGFDGDPIDLQRQLVQRVFEGREPTNRSALAINGKDLIEAGYQPGPDMGRILDYLTEQVMDDPSLNTKEQLLTMAAEMPPGGPQTPPNATLARKANILDPIQDELDPNVFDRPDSDTPDVKPEVVEWVTNLIHTTMKEAGWPDPQEYLTLVLTGSLTTYQWSEQSDFDTSLWIDVERLPEWVRADLFMLMRTHVDGKIVPGTTHPIQAFVMGRTQKMEDLYQPGVRSGYDMTRGRWIVAPEPDRAVDVKSAYPAELAYAEMVADKLKVLLQYNPPFAKNYFKLIQTQRRNDMAKGRGDFARSNIVYKYLANHGLIDAYMDVTGEYVAH